MGLFATKFAIKEGNFNKKNTILFNVVQVIANLVAWGALAPALDILIYAEPANKVFTQGICAFAANIIIIAILGTLISVAYTKIAGKSSSLKKEE